MNMEWYIKIFRSLLDWEWYDDINTCRLFIHLLLKVNYIDTKRKWMLIKKGERVTSRDNLSRETWLSVMQIRTSLKKLKSTGEITINTTSNYTLIKLNNYDKYNWNNQQINQQITNKQPTNNQQITTNKESKKEKKEKNIIYREISKEISNPKKNLQDLIKEKFSEDYINNLKTKYNIDSDNLKKEWQNFILYWTEQSSNWKKEKWEMQKTFDVQRRFHKWLDNSNKWNANLNSNKKSWIAIIE